MTLGEEQEDELPAAADFVQAAVAPAEGMQAAVNEHAAARDVVAVNPGINALALNVVVTAEAARIAIAEEVDAADLLAKELAVEEPHNNSHKRRIRVVNQRWIEANERAQAAHAADAAAVAALEAAEAQAALED